MSNTIVKPKLVFCFVMLFLANFTLSQSINQDSLQNLSFEKLKELSTDPVQFRRDSTDNIYRTIYLNKAKALQDTAHILRGYALLTKMPNKERANQYSDSLLTLARIYKKDSVYWGVAYYTKALILSEKGEYKNALDLYLKAAFFLKKHHMPFYRMSIEPNVALLKVTAGLYKEALEDFKNRIVFLKGSNFPDKDNHLLGSYYHLSLIFTNLNNQDSARYYLNKSMQLSKQLKDDYMYVSNVELSGIINYNDNQLLPAKDSLLKSLRLSKSDFLHSNVNLYLGKIESKLGNKQQSFFHYQKLDSLLQKIEQEDFSSGLLEAYPPLIEHYKAKNNIQKQLYYTNRLLRLDSIVSNKIRGLSASITKEYDVPKLLDSKNQLIHELEQDNQSIFSKSIIIISILALLFIGVVAYLYQKNKNNKKRFEELLLKQKQKQENPTETTAINASVNDVPEDVVIKILEGLDLFEEAKQFTNPKYKLDTLAKEINTNSKYLSKVINNVKGVSFSAYINHLRIEYAMEKLYQDKTFRSYSIKAIAEEMGYNNASSFSAAFYKKTQMYPSYYLENLKKSLHNQSKKQPDQANA